MIFGNQNHTTSAGEEFDPQVDDDTKDEEKEPDEKELKETEVRDKNGVIYDLDSMLRGTIIQFTDKRFTRDWIHTNRFMAVQKAYGHTVWMSDTGSLYDSPDVAYRNRNYNNETIIIGFDED